MIFHARQATIHAEAQRFKNGEDGSAPKITEQERQDRRSKMQDAWKEYVPGIMIRAQCPGRRTEDEFYTAVWKDRITEYPDLDRCTSEDQEAEAENNRKKKCRYDAPEDDKKKRHRRPTCKVDSRLEMLDSANRRSIALHLAGMMKYSQHEEWVAMLRHATDPHNIAGPVTVAEAL